MEAPLRFPTGLSSRPVLLAGQPRSGTSLLTTMLNMSTDLVQAYEIHIRKPSFINGLDGRYTYNILQQFDLERADFDMILSQHDLDKMNLGAWCGPKEAVSAEALTGWESNDFVNELFHRGCLVNDFMEHVAHIKNKSRWGFKILGDVIHISEYAQVWPNATVILLVRDPRDHALSIMALNELRKKRNQDVFYNSYSDVAMGWLKTVDYGLKKIEESGLHHLVIRYEDLVFDPIKTCNRISEELSVEMSRATNFYQSELVEKHVSRFKHHDNLQKPVNANSIDKWRSAMSASDQAIFSEIAGDVMTTYGYET